MRTEGTGVKTENVIINNCILIIICSYFRVLIEYTHIFYTFSICRSVVRYEGTCSMNVELFTPSRCNILSFVQQH